MVHRKDKIYMTRNNQNTIEIELNKLENTIKHAIKICLEDSNLYSFIDSSNIGMNISSYTDCKNIIDYIYLKIKEYFLSDYFIRAIEYFNTLPYTYNKEAMITNINFFESDYIDRYLFYKNDYVYNPKFNSTKNHKINNNELKSIKKHLVSDMKKISDYSHGDESDIINSYQKDQKILSHDSLKNFYYWINNGFNQYIFLFGCTPVKYISFFNKNNPRKVPLFFEFSTIIYSDLFFNTANHLTKSNTNLNSFKINQDNNNIENLLETYNNSLTTVKKFQSKLSLDAEYIRSNALIHYMNTIFANDFFQADDSIFLKYICSCVDFKNLFEFSKKLYSEKIGAVIPIIKLNKDTLNVIDNLQFLNILEFGVKYNIDFSKFDIILNKRYIGITETLIIDKSNIESFCKFLYLLNNNISLYKLNINFPNLSTDIKSVIKTLNDQLCVINSRYNKINLIDTNSQLYKNNYLLFSYLFLYPIRHPNFSVQGRKSNI